jgi:hypothetical protein
LQQYLIKREKMRWDIRKTAFRQKSFGKKQIWRLRKLKSCRKNLPKT